MRKPISQACIIGTIHGYCLAKLREYWSDDYHNFDILDESARSSLIFREYRGILGLEKLQSELGVGPFSGVLEQFIRGYDQLHEHNRFDICITDNSPPYELGQKERDWCAKAKLRTHVGDSEKGAAFSESSTRYYAYLCCHRFLDFATSQTESFRNLIDDPSKHPLSSEIHLVIDEVQDINPLQRDSSMPLLPTQGD
ncbi:MAG: hypothetical protein M2R45_02993 [Verrucomicrobia subdivision 3 bacterium]|nr:hypothetical protein [Limisphaerales bacterium]MCS1416521.1 hypothetical protein [Limisphaerales bacterium]